MSENTLRALLETNNTVSVGNSFEKTEDQRNAQTFTEITDKKIQISLKI